jgi:FMN phosphatase YigB (HAD superfamily)
VYEHTLPPYRNIIEESSNRPSQQQTRSLNHQQQQSQRSSFESFVSSHQHQQQTVTLKDKISCIDRRNNSERFLSLYPQVMSILEWCADNRIAMTLCSKSPDCTLIKQIMVAFGIWDWFLFPQVFNSRKTYHFRNLTEATGFKMNDFLLYDDDIANINLCNKIGVTSCLVDRSTGLTWSTFVDGLQLYHNTQKSSFVLTSWLTNPSPANHLHNNHKISPKVASVHTTPTNKLSNTDDNSRTSNSDNNEVNETSSITLHQPPVFTTSISTTSSAETDKESM